MLTRDVELKSDSLEDLLLEKHIQFLCSYSQNKDSYEQLMVQYLRMSGIYWCLDALLLMNHQMSGDERKEMLSMISLCQDPSGGLSAAHLHDPHILYTLSGIQILAIFDALQDNVIDVEKVVEYIRSLQQPDGSFFGDKWGEVDVRFSFCSIASLALLKRLDAINLPAAVDYIMSCYNLCDGGFGSRPGSESHAGLIYCCLGSLAIAGELHRIDADLLGHWLAERQLPSGGLNGRPEKLPDLCYSWWVLASMQIIQRIDWIDKNKLTRFILACQDPETGGFSDRPGNLVDPFHTLFGIAGLSLLSHHTDNIEVDADNESEECGSNKFSNILSRISSSIQDVNPVFCLPQHVIDRYDIKLQLL